ncbi:MAG: class I SAM-dependent methyltransferase [Steroidobacteraceae bacterium]
MYKVAKIPSDRCLDYRSGAFRKLGYWDVTKKWPFDDNSVEAIFSSRVVEHLPRHGARVCLKNAYRVLRKGGVQRLIVPNLDRCAADYWAESAYE